jgi:hypothetical protein
MTLGILSIDSTFKTKRYLSGWGEKERKGEKGEKERGGGGEGRREKEKGRRGGERGEEGRREGKGEVEQSESVYVEARV